MKDYPRKSFQLFSHLLRRLSYIHRVASGGLGLAGGSFTPAPAPEPHLPSRASPHSANQAFTQITPQFPGNVLEEWP